MTLIKFIVKKQKYFWIVGVFLFFILINNAFPAEIIVTDRIIESENDFEFLQLKEEETILGQIFRADESFINEIELDLDIVKQHNNGGKEYKLTIKEVKQKGWDFDIKKKPLRKIEFSVNDLGKFRQKNGKYRFPVSLKTRIGKEYFIGIDNEQMQVDRFNHLILRGSKNSDSYEHGSAAMRRGGETFMLEGDLYFKIL